MGSIIYGLLLDTVLKFPSHTPALKAKVTDLEFTLLQVYRLFANPLMDFVHICHDEILV